MFQVMQQYRFEIPPMSPLLPIQPTLREIYGLAMVRMISRRRMRTEHFYEEHPGRQDAEYCKDLGDGVQVYHVAMVLCDW
ncbi:Zinc-regulated transporter 1 [Fusarium oxysporum f. sp. albedinis]|nr:Zinc-regulated transporter 1 [Fusarium oxysporum f. sp. albedinis]